MAEGFSSEENNRRIVLISLMIMICLCTVISLFSVKSSCSGKVSSNPAALEDKINPNTASAASLSRLAGIGPAKASQIISYRENFSGTAGTKAFSEISDLDKIPGIGPKTIEDINGLLSFD